MSATTDGETARSTPGARVGVRLDDTLREDAGQAGEDPGTWRPRHGTRDAAAGCVWLPRLIDKGRRVLAGEAAGHALLGDYLFGVHDPADRQLLQFLGMTNDEVLAVLRQEPDDGAAAVELVRRSGRTPAECAAWSARFSRRNALFSAMIDADEGRRAPGMGTTALRFVYNRVLMPPTYPVYQFLERRRLAQGTTRPSERLPVGASGPSRRTRAIVAPLGLILAGTVLWQVWRRRRLQQRASWRQYVGRAMG
jgi:hypothetical protein